jgi:3-methyl-2-oxobutanoate hydroxymethyltransferase
MSTLPPSNPSQPDDQPMTLPRVAEMKRDGEPIVMITAYDYPSAQIVEEAGVDVVLVGDTAAMVVLGYDATTPVGMEEMLMMASAVRRGLKRPLLIGDLPFGSYEKSNEQAIENAQRFVKESGCDAVKLERGGLSVDRARAIVRSGIPVMGHVGLTPQTATALGGFKAQGKTAEAAAKLFEEAQALQSVGCFAIVFVLHDLLGVYDGHQAKFVKRFAEVRAESLKGVRSYTEEVRARSFPNEERHTYSIPQEELEELARYLEDEALVGTDTPWDW